MNAYIASFMLLLFNAVGLAVPASAATEERMMPEMGNAANLAEAAAAHHCADAETASIPSPYRQFCVIATVQTVEASAIIQSGKSQPVSPVFAMLAEAGDKLEHEEGAP
ncbi:MAG: hypothetical protein COA41_13965 [Sphingopyxis sp.]|nr:MAG: hypothetical protein COA41_13965 [Sphingopyxis sp.]